MARIKTVYRDHREVCHVWAHGVDRSIRAGNVFTSDDGQTIYSYGLHFPMARRVTPELVLVNPDRYSVSTAKHQGRVRAAVASWVGVVRIDPRMWSAIDEKRGLDVARHFRAKVAEAWTRANRKGITATSRISECGVIGKLMDDWTLLHRLAGFRCNVRAVPFPKDYEKNIAPWRERAHEIVKNRAALDATRDARREAARAARVEKLAPVLEELRAEWVKGGPAGKSIDGLGFVSISELETDHLRVQPSDPETVETNRSARVPLVAARTLWERLPVLPVGTMLPIDVGHYRGVRITESGSVEVGCHEFSRAAVDALAAACGWTREEAAQPA